MRAEVVGGAAAGAEENAADCVRGVEAIGCLAVLVDATLLEDVLAVDFEVIVGTPVLDPEATVTGLEAVVEALALWVEDVPATGLAEAPELVDLVGGGLAVVDVVEGLALDDPAAGGLTVELTERDLVVAELDGRGFASLELDPVVRGASSSSFVVGLRDVEAVGAFRSVVVEDIRVVAGSLAFVEVEAVVFRVGGTESTSFVVDTVLAVGRRAAAVVVAEAAVVGALTVVRVAVAGAGFLVVASVSFAFPLPAAATAVLVLLTDLVCGSGTETFKTRSISFAKTSSSLPFSTAGFLAFVTVVLAVVRVVRLGPGSSALDVDLVAKRVGILVACITPNMTLGGGLNEKKSRSGQGQTRQMIVTWYIL